MLYTSYFARAKEQIPSVEVASIARFTPRWFHGKEVDIFAPSKEMLLAYKNGAFDEEEYTARFQKEVLSKLTFSQVQRELYRFLTDDYLPIWESETNHVLLCCYEKDGEFCHRHLIAKHLRSMGIACEEITPEILKELKDSVQKDVSTR